MMRRSWLIFLFFIILEACIEPYSLQQVTAERKLMVEGLITNNPGPYQVKLYYSLDLANTNSDPIKETGASVWIISDNGESELLTELESGLYQTAANGIQGEVGVSYKLKIVTSANKQYESAMELMQSAGAIENLRFEFVKDGTSMPAGAKIDTRDIFKMYIDAKGIEKKSNLFRWRWTGVSMGESSPELHTKFIGRAEVPDPPACSGYIVGARGIVKVADCTCCICWGFEYNSASIISDNRYTQENIFKNILLGELAVTRMRFSNRFYFEVEQLTLSEEIYNFWKLAREQQRASGNLFQPNSVKIVGNIQSITDPEEEVLGIFEVAGATKKSIFVNPTDLPYTLAPIDKQPEDCRTVLPNAETSQPLFW